MIVLFPFSIFAKRVFMIVRNTTHIALFDTFKIYILLRLNNSPVMRFLMLKMNDHVQLIITIVIHYVNYINFDNLP